MPKAREVVLSTWPFADGFPWDEDLISRHHRALSTHGPTGRRKPKPLRIARDPAARRAALEQTAALA